MKRTHSAPLTDHELRPLLEARDVVSFVSQPVRLEEIERHVERLGFDDLYVGAAQRGSQDQSKASIVHGFGSGFSVLCAEGDGTYVRAR
jgi:hypothetical protein